MAEVTFSPVVTGRPRTRRNISSATFSKRLRPLNSLSVKRAAVRGRGDRPLSSGAVDYWAARGSGAIFFTGALAAVFSGHAASRLSWRADDLAHRRVPRIYGPGTARGPALAGLSATRTRGESQ